MQRGTWILMLGRALAAPLFILLALGGLTRLPFAAAQQTAADFIYWTDEIDSRPRLGSIWRASLDGSGKTRLASGQRDCFGLALDVAGGKMYWTDEDSQEIRSANLDGTGQTVLRRTSPKWTVGIALDVAAGRMYWADPYTGAIPSSRGDIESASLDGKGAATILVRGLAVPLGIALDLPHGKMYWTESGTLDIERANLDGSGRERLVTLPHLPLVGYVEDVALDLAHGKLYWTQTGIGNSSGRIGRANLDGSDQQILLEGLSEPIGIALDVAGGKMYWADIHNGLQGKGDISAANLDGTGRQTILTGLNVPGHIALQLQSIP